jgi:myo-inositol-1(or 4)-monophosphatase
VDPRAARDVAVDLAGRAAALLLEGWGNAGAVRHKDVATDLVTVWDTRLEAFLVEELRRMTPGVRIVAEEGSVVEGGAGDAVWYVDPLDGTVNFAHGLPVFAISLGLEVDGVPEAGVVVAPALGWTFAGARGQGATRNGAPILVSTVPTVDRALLGTGFPYDRSSNYERFEHMQRRAGAVRRLGAASLDLCFVACGWLDGHWEAKLKPWDLAAGAAIVLAAGGRMTALDGGPFSSVSGQVVASNGAIHDELVRELKGLS